MLVWIMKNELRGKKHTMKYIIFDLSEVIIMGLHGVPEKLSELLQIDENQTYKDFVTESFIKAFHGEISEDDYLTEVLETTGWEIELEELKKILRDNFHNMVDGTLDIVKELKEKYKILLLTDHIKEWIDYIFSVHDFFNIFDKTFLSYELKGIKRNPDTFKKVLRELDTTAEQVLFIDDSTVNVDTANSLGIKGIVFKDSKQLREDLKRLDIM